MKWVSKRANSYEAQIGPYTLYQSLRPFYGKWVWTIMCPGTSTETGGPFDTMHQAREAVEKRFRVILKALLAESKGGNGGG